jgi:carbon storage regulator
MFVIRRKIGESVRIGEDILVEVLESTPSRVKLGITAPPDVRVVRSEVLLAESQNRAAAGGCRPDVLASLARQIRQETPLPFQPGNVISGVPEPPDQA